MTSYFKLQCRGDSNVSLDVRVGATVIVGRHPSCALTLPDPHISSKHLALTAAIDGDTGNLAAIARDSSSNGTFVNGERIQTKTQIQIVEGDVVAFPCHDNLTEMYTFEVKLCQGEQGATSNPASAVASSPKFSGTQRGVKDESSQIGDATWSKLESLQKELLLEASRLSASVFANAASFKGHGVVERDMLAAMQAAASCLASDSPDAKTKALEALNVGAWEARLSNTT